MSQWDKASIRIVAEALFGSTWQARLAEQLSDHSPGAFPTVRVRQWYLEKNGRPVPDWAQRALTEIFLAALERLDERRDVAAEELAKRLGLRLSGRASGQP